VTEAELQAAFESRRPALKALGDWVTQSILSQLATVLGSTQAVKKFLQIPPEPRVKETDSFLEKALVRKPKLDPLVEITDQVGVRFVVLLLDDISRIGKIIESGDWDWQKDRDFQSERIENPDYFAYQSDHYVIHTKSLTQFGGESIPVGLPCEIQIRTILQHAYAEMAHSTAYKPPVRLPDADQKHVNRSLAKGSALIETTDDVFREIKTKLNEYNGSINALLARSREIYETTTQQEAVPSASLGELIADTYRALLKGVTPDELSVWAASRIGLGQTLKARRKDSVFFRDPVVILLGFLITNNQTKIPKTWPLDLEYLEQLYNAMGFSTHGLF
jgi:ppGpp synthetase/RelA/SpoT-type nucleotidyltranferase